MKQLLILILTSALCQSAFGIGSTVRGGGTPIKIDEATLQMMIEGGVLKNAMLNYLKTLQVEDIEDKEVQSLFVRLLQDDTLQKDIQTSNYSLNNECTGDMDPAVAAATDLGRRGPRGKVKLNIGGKICFNLGKLLAMYHKLALSEEQLMIRLAALAFHEHVHHFQIFDKKAVEEHEREANLIGAYVMLTARSAHEPLLKWAPSTALEASQTVQFKRWYAGLNKIIYDNYDVVDGSVEIETYFKQFQALPQKEQIHLVEAYQLWRTIVGKEALEILTPYDAAQIRKIMQQNDPYFFTRQGGWQTVAMSSKSSENQNVIVAGIMKSGPTGVRNYVGGMTVILADNKLGDQFRTERGVWGSLIRERETVLGQGFDYGQVSFTPTISNNDHYSELAFRIHQVGRTTVKGSFALMLTTNLFTGHKKMLSVDVPMVPVTADATQFISTMGKVQNITKVDSDEELEKKVSKLVNKYGQPVCGYLLATEPQ